MSISRFQQQLETLTATISQRALDADLEAWLNQHHGSNSAGFSELQQGCERGIAEGWLCAREAGGIRYGRVFKPTAELQDFSVDVVDMTDVVGPHHSHPQGEIDLVMPLDANARFDGHAAGWVVYAPGSEHKPTVTGGRALVLYLLPQGSIQFSR